jgi:broad specificity phosphatase PhoE
VDLLVVRHAESTWNAEHRWAGQRDPGLSARGHRDAAELARRLAALDPPVTSAASSDLRRARQTVQLVARALGLPPPIAVAGLRERDGAPWTGLTSRQIEARFPGELDRWRRGEVIEPPGSEPMKAFTDRVVAALGSLGAPRPGTCLLVVAHQGVLRALEHHFGAAPAIASELRGIRLRHAQGTLAWLGHW